MELEWGLVPVNWNSGPGAGSPGGLRPEVAGCARCPPPSALSRGPDLDSGAESTLANFNWGTGPGTPWESPRPGASPVENQDRLYQTGELPEDRIAVLVEANGRLERTT
jgi:hypothetical protein